MSDLKSGHLPAMQCPRPKPCQKLVRLSRLFAFSVSYTSVGRKTLRRKLRATLGSTCATQRCRSFNADRMTLFRAGVRHCRFNFRREIEEVLRCGGVNRLRLVFFLSPVTDQVCEEPVASRQSRPQLSIPNVTRVDVVAFAVSGDQ